MKITNKEEVDKWLFDNAQIKGHICKGVKGTIDNDQVNIAFINTVTDERIDIIYSD